MPALTGEVELLVSGHSSDVLIGAIMLVVYDPQNHGPSIIMIYQV